MERKVYRSLLTKHFFFFYFLFSQILLDMTGIIPLSDPVRIYDTQGL